ncbi:MAG: helix-turn-helix transcriptional regulator [Methylocystaceae bacterium]|nr:helix-turn-helix transcriptional regulator [Methylocystaceae bacterium]
MMTIEVHHLDPSIAKSLVNRTPEMSLSKTRAFEVRTLLFSFVVIAFGVVFFMIDVIADWFRLDMNTAWIEHDVMELFLTFPLVFAMIVIGMQLVRLLREHRVAQESVQVASGELLNVIYRHFDEWKLSPSEREVALLLMKGMSTQEIADIRDTKIGTVKSQSSAIYQKAGVRGRNELVAYFVEDLLAGEVGIDTSVPATPPNNT